MKNDFSLTTITKLAKKHYENLPYHNFKHAETVRKNTLKFIKRCKKYGVAVDEEVLMIAALFHDAGYSEVKTNKEAHSAKIAEKELRKIKYPSKKIAEVKATIMATEKEGPLKTTEQKIIRASDLLSFTVGYKEFLSTSKKIQKEHKILSKGEDFPIEGWTKLVKSYLKPKIKITPEYIKDDFHNKADKNINRFLKDFYKTHKSKAR